MKNLKTKLCFCILLGSATALLADPVTATCSFEAETLPQWTSSGGTRTEFGETVKPASPIGTDPNAYYFAVNSGQEPLIFAPEAYLSITSTPAYLEMLVKFTPSPEPKLENADKLCLWEDESEQLRLTAGYYKSSFGISGIVSKDYVVSTNSTAAVDLSDNSWHSVAIKFFRPLEREFYNSGFVVFFDGEPLMLKGADTIIASEAKQLESMLKQCLNNDGLEAYINREYFPTRLITEDTETLKGLGMSGSGGGVDELKITDNTNERPSAFDDYVVNKRCLKLSYFTGFTSITYKVDGKDAVTIEPDYKSGVEIIEVGSGGAKMVTITVPDGQTVKLVADSSEGVAVDNDSTPRTFTVSGDGVLEGHLELVTSDGVCELQGTSYPSIAEALDEIDEAGEGTIKLLCSTEEDVVVSNRTVTLNLDSYSLIGVNNENYPVIRVQKDGYLTIQGSGQIDSPYADTGSVATASDAAGLRIEGGKFKDEVLNRASVLELTGGSFYANGASAATFDFKDFVQEGYVAEWDGDNNCVKVGVPKSMQALSARKKLASTAATLGMSAQSEDKMMASGEEPVLEISGMQTTVVNNQTVITCTVRITVDGEGADIATVSLAQLVKVSKNLVDWTAPESITHAETGTVGVYTVTIIAPDADNYFLKLSDN